MEQNHMPTTAAAVTRPGPTQSAQARDKELAPIFAGHGHLPPPVHHLPEKSPNPNLNLGSQKLQHYQAECVEPTTLPASDRFLYNHLHLQPPTSPLLHTLPPLPSYSAVTSLSSHSHPHQHPQLQVRDPAPLRFSNTPPATELPPIQSPGHLSTGAGITNLPSILSVTSGEHHHAHPLRYPGFTALANPDQFYLLSSSASKLAACNHNHWPSLNPLTVYYTPSHAQTVGSPQTKMDAEMSGGAGDVKSPERSSNASVGGVTLDDPDVRMAAEALGDLRADLQASPGTPMPCSPPAATDLNDAPEPLFSLLTTSHPILATTIEGATTAYNNSKNFSPRFKSGAEYVEGYLTPIANTVGSVGRVTGVEGGVRWFLGAGRRHQSSSSDLEAGNGRRKRQRCEEPSEKEALAEKSHGAEMDLYSFSNKARRTSLGGSTVDSLPAYDDHRSPPYTELPDSAAGSSRPGSGTSTAWQQRLIISTSGLSIAMSEESLRSLKYCLSWLRRANVHIDKMIQVLKTTLNQHDEKQQQQLGKGTTAAVENDQMMTDITENHDTGEFAARINALKNDVVRTLTQVVETVSKYAGGALPENARLLVKRHLTSLPQRFRLASMQDNQERGEKEAVREGAHRILLLASEGLDVFHQISGVLDGTITSAEEWCERLGRKKREQREGLVNGNGEGERLLERELSEQELSGVAVDGDQLMTG